MKQLVKKDGGLYFLIMIGGWVMIIISIFLYALLDLSLPNM